MLLQRQCTDDTHHFANGLRLVHVQVFQTAHSDAFQIQIPIESGKLLLQFIVRQLIVVSFRVAKLYCAQRFFGDGRFDIHHVVHLAL